ncbi:adenylate cyclase, partial [Enterobacter asburiae]|nr:adenylate cyclase [Enterobacter asburiae]
MFTKGERLMGIFDRLFGGHHGGGYSGGGHHGG